MGISLRNRQKKIPVETRWLRKVGQWALSMLERSGAECSVLLVDDAVMADLNRTYRGVAGPTDVLAFPMAEGPLRSLSPSLLGDVVISAETAERQARSRRAGFRAELALLLIHGILHLVGYDHGITHERRRMWQEQRRLLEACGIQAGVGARAKCGRNCAQRGTER
jgi:probable rRNA maturation factor